MLAALHNREPTHLVKSHPTVPAKPTPSRSQSAPAKAMDKLGLVRDIDLALHLPLRYEDETRLTLLRDARDGDTVQVEGVVRDNRIEMRSRRQFLVKLDDGSGEVQLRFLNFYATSKRPGHPACACVCVARCAMASSGGR